MVVVGVRVLEMHPVLHSEVSKKEQFGVHVLTRTFKNQTLASLGLGLGL